MADELFEENIGNPDTGPSQEEMEEPLEEETEEETITEPMTFKNVDITIKPAGYDEEGEPAEGEDMDVGEEDEISGDSIVTDSVSATLNVNDSVTTEEGFLKFPQVTIAKEGVQKYVTADGKEEYVLKSADELKRILDHGERRHITDEHPHEKIVTKPVEIRGYNENMTFVDGELKTDIIVTCDKLAKSIQNDGKNDVSIGFHTSYKAQDGIFNDSKYSFIQTDMLLDHIAVTKSGRCSVTHGCGFTPDKKKEAVIIRTDSKKTKSATAKLTAEQQKAIDTANKIIADNRVDVIADILSVSNDTSQKVLDSMSYDALIEMRKALMPERQNDSISFTKDSSPKNLIDKAYGME